MTKPVSRKLALGAVGALVLALTVAAPVSFNPLAGGFSQSVALAKHGADDPKGDDHGKHGGKDDHGHHGRGHR